MLDTILILNVEDQIQRRKTAEMSPNGTSGAQSASERMAATELAFQNLPRIERPAVDP